MCRVVFLAGCILPTLAVMAWATYQRLPTTADSRLAVVERMLGMRVDASSVDTPLPGVVRCRDLQLANVETGEVVLTAAVAHVHTEGPTPRVRLSGVSLAEGELSHLATSLHRTLEVDWPGSVRVELSNVAWQENAYPSARELLAGQLLVITLESTQQQGEITGRRCVIETNAAGPRIEVLRNRQVTPPATRVVLDTAGQQVPADWLVSLGALVVEGGDQATFAGQASIVRSADRTSGTLSGELAGVALAQALSIPLDTVGNLQNLNVYWQDGRITSAEGDLVAESGSMPGVFARTIEYYLYRGTPQPGSQAADTATVKFGWLGARFRLREDSLTLWPLANAEFGACVLDSESQVLFGRPLYYAPVSDVGTVLTHFGGDRGVEVSARLPRALRR